MAINTQITRITTLRNRIRNHLVNWGLVESTADLEDLTDAIESVTSQGAVSAQVREGETYTIPAGYHNGSGTVQGVAGGGNYSLQDKGSVTPTKSQQSITPDSGYYGISSVVVEAIPEAYQDVSSVDAAAADVLANKKFVTSDGTLTAGSMVNNGAISYTLDAEHTSYTVPQGYHNGSGTVQLGGTMADVSGATVTPGDMLEGVKAIVMIDGEPTEITGTIADRGAISGTIDGLNSTSYTVPAGYTSGGSVSLTDDIETALAGI